MFDTLRLVEIEISSFCNRRCTWCPNTVFDRNTHIHMPEETYTKILSTLGAHKYNKVISFSRYNEPMANINLLKKYTHIAKELLPEIKLVTNTNGDYLSGSYLKDLAIDELTIMDYDCRGRDYCIKKLLDCDVTIIDNEYLDKNKYIIGVFDEMTLLYCLNWPKNAELTDRGGFLTENIIRNMKDSDGLRWKNNKILRTGKCMEPVYFLGIDYNGSITPCCEIRSDNPEHSPFILGNINNIPLEDIYNSKKAHMFRETMMNNTGQHIPFPCTYCQKEPGRYTKDTPSIYYENGENNQ